jgi:hypothetical protein
MINKKDELGLTYITARPSHDYFGRTPFLLISRRDWVLTTWANRDARVES